MKSSGLMKVTDALGLTEGRLLATPSAVILGLTYNFLPFMTLPLYTSLEKIDRILLGRRRSVRQLLDEFLEDHLAAVPARCGRRHAADLHPGRR